MIDQLPNSPNTTRPPQNLPTGPTDQGLGDYNDQGISGPEPLGEPEDILEGIDSSPEDTQRPAKVSVSEMSKPFPFSGKESEPVGRPTIPTLAPDGSAPVKAAVAPPEKSISKEPFFKQGRKAVGALLVVIVTVGALGAAGWYGFGLLTSSTAQPEAPLQNQTGEQADNVEPQPNVSDNTGQPAEPAVQNVDQVSQPVDTDRDGLTDQEENLYGTNPERVDTDHDGLTDRDEVKVFETDPNNPDTDGDTYPDGQEVRSGYDPKGDGRLLEIE